MCIRDRRLFRMEAEIYNLDLLFRAKAFFSPQLTPEDLKKLLIPVYGVLSAKNMNALADTRGLDEFLKLYNGGRAGQVYGARSADPADASEVSETRALYRAAQKLLHLSLIHIFMWPSLGLNQGPPDYESVALTT